MIGGDAVLGKGRELTVGGFSSGWLGIETGGWCWWYISYWSGVGLVGWWAVGRGVCLVWVVRVEVTLSVQDLVCDGSRCGVWHLCWLLMWLCGWFWLPGWALVGGWWG